MSCWSPVFPCCSIKTLWPDASAADIQGVMELRGMKRTEQSEVRDGMRYLVCCSFSPLTAVDCTGLVPLVAAVIWLLLPLFAAALGCCCRLVVVQTLEQLGLTAVKTAGAVPGAASMKGVVNKFQTGASALTESLGFRRGK